MPRQRRRSNESIRRVNGRVYVFRGEKVAMEIIPGKMFAGSMVHPNGKWANCRKCGKRIAIGVQCTCGKKLREHVDAKKPDDIKGS